MKERLMQLEDASYRFWLASTWSRYLVFQALGHDTGKCYL